MYTLSELSTASVRGPLNNDDVANTDAGVDVGDPAGILITRRPDRSVTYTFPFESTATPSVVVVPVVSDVTVAANGADVGPGVGVADGVGIPVNATPTMLRAVLHATYSVPVAALKPGWRLLLHPLPNENDGGGVVDPYGAAATSITNTVPLDAVAYRCPPGSYARPHAWSLSVASSVITFVT
jgi:hypothetical protein